MMPGARPADSGAVLAIWQDADQIPWELEPIKPPQQIGSQQQGDYAFSGLTLQDNSYIIGLTVGPMKTDSQKARNVAASAFVLNATEPAELKQDFLTLKFVGQNSVTVQFNCLSGYRAFTDGAWLGIWRGDTASYSKPPDGAIAISIDSNFGTASFNNFPVGLGLTYTIGFFNSGWSETPTQRNQKVLAASLTFTQGQTAQE